MGPCLTEDCDGVGGGPGDMAMLAAALAQALPVEPFLSSGVTAACLVQV
tara:strand:+ start:1110 stop:1256 length:147 start_codon:yes stop_codon:yes gene_type:complete